MNRILTALLASTCAAQTLAQASLESTGSASGLETVNVTAPLLNKALEVNAGAFGAKDAMEIPIAIQSYTAESIAALSARTVQDVLEYDPSITGASNGGGFDNFRIRGFVMDNFNTIRRDGLSLAPHHDMPLELFERVDVLKGPSGFLYGFNSPGGTVNYLPKRPTRTPFVNVTAQGSSLEGRYTSLDSSNSAFDGAFGYRVNLGYEKNGNFDHTYDMERKFIGLATDFRLGERGLLQLSADYSSKTHLADPLLRADQGDREDPLDPASFVLPPRVDRRDALAPTWFRHETDGHNADARFEFALNDAWTSVSQANYSRVERHGGYNDLFSIQPNGDVGYADYYVSRGEVFSVWSLQSYLAGTFQTGSILHDTFFGASYKRFKDKSPYWDFVESGGELTPADVSVGNILDPVDPPRWHWGPENAVDYKATITERSLFASDLLSLNDHVQLLLGGRYIQYRARELSAQAPPQDDNVFVPTGALIYRPGDAVMTYLSYTRGFEKGEYAPFFTNNPNQPTDAIESEQYEIGLKASIDRRLSLGIAAFNIDRDANYVNLDNDFVGGGTYRHRGVELSAVGEVTAGLKLHGNLAYLDTQLTGVADPTVIDKRSEGVPRWKGTLGARYDLAAVPGLSLDSTLSYVGNRAVDAQNTGFIPSYTLWDAGISYDTTLGGTPTTFRLHGRNLGNKYYYASAQYQGGLMVGREREIFLSANIRF
ncbi:TonB-dependent siderophore receptor [Parahaliea mediterranea]|uniref:TonB-dependent receptor n=1 Tax=Parahaliea mediterranea TaxID=651086 RepID=A0A939DD39_9GAMM|nr:TonB-dependent receptor [Parahaliea mediterranea]MBN7796013.1 TonB-dependent receptor [Parahaliea mediterranea]